MENVKFLSKNVKSNVAYLFEKSRETNLIIAKIDLLSRSKNMSLD